MATAAVVREKRGRPHKKVPKGERTQIGVIVGGKTKALLLKAMKESGRTISREAEHLIEKALMYEQWLSVFSGCQLQRFEPKPGDVFVLNLPFLLSRMEAEGLASRWNSMVPHNECKVAFNGKVVFTSGKMGVSLEKGTTGPSEGDP